MLGLLVLNPVFGEEDPSSDVDSKDVDAGDALLRLWLSFVVVVVVVDGVDSVEVLTDTSSVTSTVPLLISDFNEDDTSPITSSTLLLVLTRCSDVCFKNPSDTEDFIWLPRDVLFSKTPLAALEIENVFAITIADSSSGDIAAFRDSFRLPRISRPMQTTFSCCPSMSTSPMLAT